MGLHKPFSRGLFTINGSVMTQGGSLNLVKGQFGIFDTESQTVDGLKAVSSFVGESDNKKFEIRLGNSDAPRSKTYFPKSFSTFPFTLNDVVKLEVDAPKVTEAKVDEVVVGYNGIDAKTALKFQKGTRKNFTVELSGEYIGLLGYPKSVVTFPVYMESQACPSIEDECVDCDPCAPVSAKPIVAEAVDFIKNYQLKGDISVGELIDVNTILSCQPTYTEESRTFYKLTVCDTGDSGALALVQQQYPGVKILRSDRTGALSTYRLSTPQTIAPTNYVQTIPSIIKGCETCPSGYTKVEGGFVYAIAIDDEGVDVSSKIEALAGAVVGTAIKSKGQDLGIGFYTVVVKNKLTDSNISTFVTANPSAKIEFVNSVVDLCSNATTTSFAWSADGSAKFTTAKYFIDLPDNECGESRLKELQSVYPRLTITEEGTKGGCQRRYITSVNSNFRGTECSPIFNDLYSTDAPESYDSRDWQPVVSATADPVDCLVGFKLKGKVFTIDPSDCIDDKIAFSETSVRIRVSGGYPSEIREGIGNFDLTPVNVEYLSYAQDRSHLGGNLKQLEKQARTFFTGQFPHKGFLAKELTDEHSVLDNTTQYVDYAITIKRDHYSQSFSRKELETNTYHVYAPVGRHIGVERLLNALAAGAGVQGVKAFGDV